MRTPRASFPLVPLLGLALACGSGGGGATYASSTGETSSGTGETATTTGSSGGETEATGTGDHPDTGCEFVGCRPDIPCTSGCFHCDLFAQDCPRGQKCAPWYDDSFMWNATRCVPVTGDSQPGDPCTTPEGPTEGRDTCDLGNLCLYVDPETGEGVCMALCYGSPRDPVCPADAHCRVPGQGIFGLCLPVCDPLAGDCPPHQICAPIPNLPGFHCQVQGDSIPGGAPCRYPETCEGGHVCLATAVYPHVNCEGSSGCCAPYCHLDAPECPPEPAGLECVPWYEQGTEPPGYEHVGACQSPP